MKNYFVTFHYTVQVRADDQERADEKAWEVFAQDLPGLRACDFCADEPEVQWWDDTEEVPA